MTRISTRQGFLSAGFAGSRWTKRRSALLICLCLLAVLVILVSTNKWDSRLYFHLASAVSTEDRSRPTIALPEYQVVIQRQPVTGIDRNLSSIVHNWDTDELLALSNGPAHLITLDKTGNTLAEYPLEGFGDIEAITYLGDGQIIIVDERAHRLNVVRLPDTPGPINVADAQYLSLGIGLDGNKGFEGIAYDPSADRLFIVKERDPKQLLMVTGLVASLGSGLTIDITDLTDWIDNFFGTDLSSVYFDRKTGHLLLLSDESNLVVELDAEGKFVSYRSFSAWSSDLDQAAPQPEGIAMDADGILYMVSEPNFFYSFAKPPQSQQARPDSP